MTTVPERLVRMAAATLPPHSRARYREQWLADLRDADELSVHRGGIVFGAFGFAAGAVTRSLLSSEIRASRSWVQSVILVLLLGVPLFFGLVANDLAHWFGTPGAEVRDNFGIFSEFMLTPLIYLLLPLYVVFLSCLRLSNELGHRFASSTRSRVRVESYVFAKLIVATGTSFIVFFGVTFALFLLAFYLWPLIGNPSIDPGTYFLTPDTALSQSYSDTTYSQLLALGPMTYGVLYSAWVGFCASIWAALGMAALLLVPNRALALALPFVIYFAQFVAASLAGNVRGSFVASMFPFGYQQTTILAGVTPMLVLAAIVGAGWIALLRRLPFVESLS